MKKIQGLSRLEIRKIFQQYLLKRKSLMLQKEIEERKVVRIQDKMLSMANTFSVDEEIDDDKLALLCVKKINVIRRIEEINETLKHEGEPLKVYLTLSKMR